MSEAQNTIRRDREDPRSTLELFAEALTAREDEPAYWCCVRALQRRGTREAFEIATSLAFSADWRERELAVDTIGQLGIPERAFKEEAEAVVLQVLELESHPGVLADIASALGHTGGERSVPHLLALSRHSDGDVRFAAVCSLSSREEDAVIARVVELTQDPESLVRDWATFALASSEKDTPEIRSVLLYRTRDEDDDTRDEAMRGLAARGDARVVEPLLLCLAGQPGRLALEAARTIGDPRLYPSLQRLAVRGGVDEDGLAEALAACRPRKQ
jgi:HEAT repeat protein